MKIKSSILVSFFIITLKSLFAQKNHTIEYILPENAPLHKIVLSEESIEYSKRNLDKTLQSKQLYLYENGYLQSSFDSIITDSLKTIVYVALGAVYKWVYLDVDSFHEEALNKVGFRDKLYINRPFSIKNFTRLVEKLLSYYENNGYPFCEIRLDSLTLEKNTIGAKLVINKNKLCRIDSILVAGTQKTTESFIQNYIAVKEGGIYNEKSVKNINKKLAELPFLNVKSSPQVFFSQDETKIKLFLEEKKANYFNGVLGVLPDNTTGKIQTTGDVALKLINTLGKGEKLDVNWRKLQLKTQDLKVMINYPFILNMPFGLDADLKIYKRDTTFLNINSIIGIQYLLSGGNYFKAFVENKTSTLLSTKAYENNPATPSNADTRITAYGVGFRKYNLDYFFNPKKGYDITLNASVGNKIVKPNAKLIAESYDSLELKTTQYEYSYKVNVYIQTSSRSTINLGANGAQLINTVIFENETYRIGGLKMLRGFNEESINASLYTIGTIEWRYLLDRNSYFLLFADGGYYENVTKKSALYAVPLGLGMGVSFETKAGIFTVNYAVGTISGTNNSRYFRNGFNLQNSKIHFGFVNFF